MKKNCRLAWKAPTGATGHGTKWVTRDKAQSYVDAMCRKVNKYFPSTNRFTYWVETKDK